MILLEKKEIDARWLNDELKFYRETNRRKGNLCPLRTRLLCIRNHYRFWCANKRDLRNVCSCVRANFAAIWPHGTQKRRHRRRDGKNARLYV